MSIEGMLRGHDLFGALAVEEVHQISEVSLHKRYEKNQTIFEHHQEGQHVFLLLEGTVYLRLPSEIPEFSIVVSKIVKGELFGLSPLLGSSSYTTAAQSAARSDVLVIKAKPFRQLLQSNATTGFNIMSQVAQVYFNRYLNLLNSLQGVVNQIPLVR